MRKKEGHMTAREKLEVNLYWCHERRPRTAVNLYWCHEKGEYCGLWVVATTRGKAKHYYCMETETDYCDIRGTLCKKDVGDVAEGCVDAFDEETLKTLGVEYSEDDE
jgi:hypothetical protein